MTTGGCENKASSKAGGGMEAFIDGGAIKFCDGGILAIILSKVGGDVRGGGKVCSFDAPDDESKSNEGGGSGAADVVGIEGATGCACLARS
jgi:hypothetical protein